MLFTALIGAMKAVLILCPRAIAPFTIAIKILMAVFPRFTKNWIATLIHPQITPKAVCAETPAFRKWLARITSTTIAAIIANTIQVSGQDNNAALNFTCAAVIPYVFAICAVSALAFVASTPAWIPVSIILICFAMLYAAYMPSSAPRIGMIVPRWFAAKSPTLVTIPASIVAIFSPTFATCTTPSNIFEMDGMFWFSAFMNSRMEGVSF